MEEEKSIEQLNTKEILTVINQEDQQIATVIAHKLPLIEAAVEIALMKFSSGGRVIYCGAGSSGRIAAMDAIEMQPTYGLAPDRYFGLIAGGDSAMFRAVESVEDSTESAQHDLASVELSSKDVLVAVAASGQTPYCLAALAYARQVGAATIAISCVDKSSMAALADAAIDIPVGQEVVRGSTRMKAGTAQKMVLNMFSTAIMVRTGKVYQNLMVNLQPTNQKLIKRATAIISQLTDISLEQAENYLAAAENSVPLAVIMVSKKVDLTEARRLYDESQGILWQIIN